jgi:hypothetical protein
MLLREMLMQLSKHHLLLLVSAVAIFALPARSEERPPPRYPRRFTVADDIDLTQFDQPERTVNPSILYSPDHKYFLVLTERGRRDLNCVESSIRIYRTKDASDFVSQLTREPAPLPIFSLSKAVYKYGPVIHEVHWVPESTGVAFLAKTASGNDQLWLVDVITNKMWPLTREDEFVTGFNVLSRTNFVYTVMSPAIQQKAMRDERAAAVTGTGESLPVLMFPHIAFSPDGVFHDLSEAWAVTGGRKVRVDGKSGHPLPIHIEGTHALALRPNGRYVATVLAVTDVPTEWEALYRPPYPSVAAKVKAGPQDTDAFNGIDFISEFVLLDLPTGKTKRLTGAPTGAFAGWSGNSQVDWSFDGRYLVLSNTFVAPKKVRVGGRPCAAAVVDVDNDDLVCLELKTIADRVLDGTEAAYREAWPYIYNAHFVHGNSSEVEVTYRGPGVARKNAIFRRAADGTWNSDETEPSLLGDDSVDISIKQDLNVPPVLMVRNQTTQVSRVLWDPNPQLRSIGLADESVFRWKDKNGRDWIGGLYKPPDYVEGRRYPLVIQTHGFREHDFIPNGLYPTVFAAQELAAVGFIVLQVRDCVIRETIDEGPCQVAGYEAAVFELASAGLVDPSSVGIAGFSRTCYYVLEALTTSTLQFKAALIADGINAGYLQYMAFVDHGGQNIWAHDAESLNGGRPFGSGLTEWLARSPEFKMDRVTAPLQVVSRTGEGLLLMWEPYAALHYLHKPVDLLVLNSEEHVSTNPGGRLVSQQDSVDWFRFWLKGEEDPDPAKTKQYGRWRELRKLQDKGGAETKEQSAK